MKEENSGNSMVKMEPKKKKKKILKPQSAINSGLPLICGLNLNKWTLPADGVAQIHV